MIIASHIIGVCSWSLRPKDLADLATQVRSLNLEHVQLAIGPLLDMDEPARQEQLEHLRRAGVSITAGMIGFADEDYSSITRIQETGGFVPTALWPQRRQRTAQAAALCKQMGLKLLTAHLGFVPQSNHPSYEVMLQRVKELAGILGEKGLELGMETGQEPAGELLQFINDLGVRNISVNFDPANMILYGAGDPIAAVKTLGRHIHHVHIKDGVLSKQPGVLWGDEVPFGTGTVGAARFLAALEEVGYRGPLCIEREAGEKRLDDVRHAMSTLQAGAGK